MREPYPVGARLEIRGFAVQGKVVRGTVANIEQGSTVFACYTVRLDGGATYLGDLRAYEVTRIVPELDTLESVLEFLDEV